MEYVKRIRALRWLAMALRAQETAQARLMLCAWLTPAYHPPFGDAGGSSLTAAL